MAKLPESWGVLAETQGLKGLPGGDQGYSGGGGGLSKGEWRALRAETCERLQGTGRMGSPSVEELAPGIQQKPARSVVPSVGSRRRARRVGRRGQKRGSKQGGQCVAAQEFPAALERVLPGVAGGRERREELRRDGLGPVQPSPRPPAPRLTSAPPGDSPTCALSPEDVDGQILWSIWNRKKESASCRTLEWSQAR